MSSSSGQQCQNLVDLIDELCGVGGRIHAGDTGDRHGFDLFTHCNRRGGSGWGEVDVSGPASVGVRQGNGDDQTSRLMQRRLGQDEPGPVLGLLTADGRVHIRPNDIATGGSAGHSPASKRVIASSASAAKAASASLSVSEVLLVDGLGFQSSPEPRPTPLAERLFDELALSEVVSPRGVAHAITHLTRDLDSSHLSHTDKVTEGVCRRCNVWFDSPNLPAKHPSVPYIGLPANDVPRDGSGDVAWSAFEVCL